MSVLKELLGPEVMREIFFLGLGLVVLGVNVSILLFFGALELAERIEKRKRKKHDKTRYEVTK